MAAPRLGMTAFLALALGACGGIDSGAHDADRFAYGATAIPPQSLTRAPAPSTAGVCPKTLAHLKPALVRSGGETDLDAPVNVHFAKYGGRRAAARALAMDVEMTEEALARELDARETFEMTTDLSARAELDRRIAGLEDELLVQMTLMSAAQCRHY